MRTSRPVVIAVAVFALLIGAAGPPALGAGPQESIAITEAGEWLEITVPVSRLLLKLPAGAFVRTPPAVRDGATANPRYFIFRDRAGGLILSGWFEPASRFSGVKEPEPGRFQGERLVYENVSRQKIGEWDTVSYVASVRSMRVANVRAHVVRAGTWIELHLSASPDTPLPEQHAALAQTIESLQVAERR